ncbi:hypothetical protein BGZ95_004245 [Linnemannia exigua]|uniref:Extracellular membrane protein CFEM domain-containing protein n=1 Tax=Linnemannia exigua TaxID=604196 RepID=A0AAD4H826_9FUNG|nr:hypothetical protein BGZ95_004245 [Linnemannia exigua]
MRFSTSTLLIVPLTLTCTFTLAQQSPSPSPACQECLSKAGVVQVPSCTGSNAWSNNTVAVDSLTPEQKNCYCQLSSNDAWVKSCSGTDQCGQEVTDAFVAVLVAVKPAVCPAKSAAGDRLGVEVVASVAVAAAAVFSALFL